MPVSAARAKMVERQLSRRGIRDEGVLRAMRDVPREDYVEPGMEEFAFDDSPLPIGEGQTISQPYIVAFMAEAAALSPGDRVLEVGTGSGYAAAVFSRLAKAVYTVERYPSLADAAKQRLARAGIGNVFVQFGDGTLGWADAAPFDAIIVAAGAPEVPAALKQQLAIGGRLIIPVGASGESQSLLKVTHVTEALYETEELAPVRFVPLVGAQGWTEDGRRAAAPHVPAQMSCLTLPQTIARAAEPLPDFDDPAFGALFDRFASRRVVLLGEASHGTSEFYRARDAITRRLIAQHGFSIVAVEADWPDAAAIDRYVRLRPDRHGDGAPFQRFPTWMWRNTDVAAFVVWLRRHNETVPQDRRAGFFGLDIYNMRSSIAAVLAYLDRVDPDAATIARERYGCLTPWQKEPSIYGRAVLTEGYKTCEGAVVRQCRDILAKQLDYTRDDGDRFLDAAQNARLIASAERYYRIMYYGGAESWNLRDTHMFETLEHLLRAKGDEAKAVVWAHNSHIGDARHTEMGSVRSELNIGQLCRERFGADAALIGFSTHTGTVAAAADWDGPMETMQVQPSRRDSFERAFHDSDARRSLVDFSRDAALRELLREPRLERFIGVIYRPDSELMSHYAEASLSQQFDAMVWFDETQAVEPLSRSRGQQGVPDTYPFGL
ncbi:protein-L-isoaspartate(D-aspartate) O-methyltransferase [Bradyrhizobium sp. LHD-71]|uniref:protein-L-isoaspartate(D-aspartate) O-methyltransferase n=1 Tax=Bradyrhizobium sp. LHD-71 TaxID=3072141 RepID=UPI00280EC23B|nr:protein-L-isoaspartate(D-aspartate) O-methyltransferase [Bradyrhizobium sp. LHD-71]MDQ8729374.1 protein-L-isoaspartate(D-aspartate) O-methyltransferase [Bradyrhizobium sp. LHD-71]